MIRDDQLKNAEGMILIYLTSLRGQLDEIERAVREHKKTFTDPRLVGTAGEIFAACRIRDLLVDPKEDPR